MSSPISSSPKPEALVAHELELTKFLMPQWCDMCNGIVVGSAYRCVHGCKQICHLGLGAHGAENCKADLLLTPCNRNVEHKKGSYQFGDITKQLFRNQHQKIKDVVVGQIVKEQESFGKFDKLKQFSNDIQEHWDADKVKTYVFHAQVISLLVSWLLTSVGMLGLAWPMHGFSKAYNVALIQAWSNCASLTFAETLLLVGLHLLSHQVIARSEIVEAFAKEILQIDLRSLGIDLASAAIAVTGVTYNGVCVSLTAFVLAFALWLRAVQHMYTA